MSLMDKSIMSNQSNNNTFNLKGTNQLASFLSSYYIMVQETQYVLFHIMAQSLDSSIVHMEQSRS